MLNLIQMLAGRPWAIRADIAAHVHGLMAREGIAGLRHLASLKSGVHAFDDDGGGRSINSIPPRIVGSVGIVSLRGLMTQFGDAIESAETRSTAAVARDVATLAGDTRIDAVLLMVDSPGGEVYGVPEAWATVAAAAKIKPVIAVANAQMASAALYLASAATELWITPSGEAGSMGVYSLHQDMSAALDAEGVKLEFVVADGSPFKVEGNPYEPLSDDARASIKKSVNRYMSLFVRDAAKGRGVSASHALKHFGQGRMLGPEEAVAAKMADQIGTIEQALAYAAKVGAAGRRSRASVRAEDLLPEPMAMEEAPVTRIVAAEPDPEPEPAVIPEPVVGLTPDQIAALARLSTL